MTFSNGVDNTLLYNTCEAGHIHSSILLSPSVSWHILTKPHTLNTIVHFMHVNSRQLGSIISIHVAIRFYLFNNM